MATKIRLQRHGSKKRPFYFIVVTNSTNRRDGRFIEKLGTYNPLTVPATIQLDRERSLHWLDNGAEPTNTCRRILSFKGVLFLKHLMRGVKLGLFDEKTALEKFEGWNASHETLVADRETAHKKKKAEVRAAAQAPIIKKVEEVAPVIEEAPTVEEAPAVEETPVVDTPVEAEPTVASEATETPAENA